MTRVLDLIIARGWHIHFIMVQVWYYAFVDIIDSIIDDVNLQFSMKDTLYRILKSFPNETVNLFSMYKYPNIRNNDKESFIEGLISIVNHYMSVSDNSHHDFVATMIKQSLIHSKDKELVFLQDEKSNEWVPRFVHIYRAEIYNNPNKTLVMDTETQVEKELRDNPIMINGNELKNFRFVNSSTSPMIQVCDYVVAILRKYFVFVDRSFKEIEYDISLFDDFQLDNFKKLNMVLKKSQDFNPMYFHYVSCEEMRYNLNLLMNEYG